MYHFPLEPVLSHRDTLAKAIQKELADLQRRLNQAETSLNDLKGRRQRICLEFEKTQKTIGMTAAEILTTMRYLETMDNLIVLGQREVKEAEDLCTRKRLLLIEAMKKMKTIERLKVKGFQQYTRDLQKKESNFLDEVAVTRFKGGNRLTQTSLVSPEGAQG